MPGLVVIGPTADAVARAIDPDAWVLDSGGGTPAVAAAHAGREHRPGELADAARTADVVALDADILAPLTPRYAVRDLALELGAPVVLAVEARDALTGPARAAAEAVRAGGLPVAAIVLTGWPEQPSRTLIDERVILHEATALPVLTLSGAERPDWPVDEWREAPPVPGVGAAAGVKPQRVALEPYRAWEGEAPGDPRTAPRPRIMETLVEIVADRGADARVARLCALQPRRGRQEAHLGRARAAVEQRLPPGAGGQGRAHARRRPPVARRRRRRAARHARRSSSASSARASSSRSRSTRSPSSCAACRTRESDPTHPTSSAPCSTPTA